MCTMDADDAWEADFDVGNLPDGAYCNVITSDDYYLKRGKPSEQAPRLKPFQSHVQEMRGFAGNNCTDGQEPIVVSDGRAHVVVPSLNAVAVHV